MTAPEALRSRSLSARPLPPGPLIAFYGDDFTGSSAAMEVTAFAGIDTVLFLSPPTPERLSRFAHCQVIGIAGVARAQSPDWMDEVLPAIFTLLAETGAPVIHYKVCSTFDSAPHIGSIGRAIDCARRQFSGWTPMVVADPGMGRYQAFGHLFASIQGRGHRLDRHPVMARHPSTPMDEADLAVHLSRQTRLKTGLVDFVSMKRGTADQRLADEIKDGAEIVSLDVLDGETLAEAGRLIWERGAHPCFAVGSQGLEAVLVAWWRQAGFLPGQPVLPTAGPADRVVCVSGSVSPVTAGQIAFARERGFRTIALDAARAVDAGAWAREIGRAGEAALVEVGLGRDVIVHSAAGPDDPAVAAFQSAMALSGAAADAVNERIGTGLGAILDHILAQSGPARVVISGGDTSGRAAARLGIDALTAIAPLAPGAPLCRAHSDRADRDGLQIALKGGQVGGPDFFAAARQGAPL
jgi:3-oxoisoapionate kinase